MVEQSHAVEYLLNRIGQQIASANSQEQRNQAAKAATGSELLKNALDRVSDERVQDKMENVKKNPDLLDHVHISPEAHDLYSRHINAENAPDEKIHGRKQAGLPQEPKILPEPPPES